MLTVLKIDNFMIASILSILLRYLSDLSYCIFLIWAIETFPTVCRTTGVAFVLVGSSFGTILAYSLKEHRIAELLISIILYLIGLKLIGHVRPNHENKLFDTLKNEYYD